MVAPHEPTSKACELTCSPIRVREAPTWQARASTLYRLSRGPYAAAETTLLACLPTLVEDLLDIVGRSYDGIDYVVVHDIHETMLDPGESDYPLAAVGVVAQTPSDVAANFYLHTRLAEVDVAVTAQLKAHRVLHNPMKPLIEKPED